MKKKIVLEREAEFQSNTSYQRNKIKKPSFAGHALLLGENIKTFLLLRSELEHGTKSTMHNCKQKFLKRNCTDLFVIYSNISFYQIKNITLKFICCLCEEHDFRKIADHFRAIY